jgi:DNA modification methylase
VLIAAERTGRKARAIEIDPHYVDVAVRRWEQFTGKKAVSAPLGETFEAASELRLGNVA